MGGPYLIATEDFLSAPHVASDACSCSSCECVRLRAERDAAIQRAEAAERVVDAAESLRRSWRTTLTPDEAIQIRDELSVALKAYDAAKGDAARYFIRDGYGSSQAGVSVSLDPVGDVAKGDK